VPDGVCVVWAGLLKKPLEVVCRRPHWTLIVAHDSRDAPRARDARLPVLAIVVAGRGRSPLKELFAPLVAAFDVLLGIVSGDVGRCLLVATRCHLPTSLCWAKHGCLIAGGALGGDATRLLKRAPKEVVMSALPWALHIAFRQRIRATLVSLVANMMFATPSLLLPWWGLG
jgi:hypothetical protein